MTRPWLLSVDFNFFPAPGFTVAKKAVPSSLETRHFQSKKKHLSKPSSKPFVPRLRITVMEASEKFTKLSSTSPPRKHSLEMSGPSCLTNLNLQRDEFGFRVPLHIMSAYQGTCWTSFYLIRSRTKLFRPSPIVVRKSRVAGPKLILCLFVCCISLSSLLPFPFWFHLSLYFIGARCGKSIVRVSLLIDSCLFKVSFLRILSYSNPGPPRLFLAGDTEMCHIMLEMTLSAAVYWVIGFIHSASSRRATMTDDGLEIQSIDSFLLAMLATKWEGELKETGQVCLVGRSDSWLIDHLLIIDSNMINTILSQ